MAPRRRAYDSALRRKGPARSAAAAREDSPAEHPLSCSRARSRTMLRQQRMIPAALLAAPLIALAIASCSNPATQENATTATAPEDSIARGRYLATLGGCGDCHTPGYLYRV